MLPIFPRKSDVFALWLCFQMANRVQNQVVRLTRCLDVPGHTAMLVRVMIETGYRWYPEYTVEEQFRDFNQSQYLCTVRIFPSYPGSTEPLHYSYGLGVTVEMAVQDAAYSMMTILRSGLACFGTLTSVTCQLHFRERKGIFRLSMLTPLRRTH